MNTLQRFLAETGMDEIKAMNALQDRGIVSDNCIGPGEVAECDCAKAIAFLKQYGPSK